MPGRNEPFISGYIYHIFNKTIDSRRIFENNTNPMIFLETLKYYRSTKATRSLSDFRKYKQDQRNKLLKAASYKKYFKVDILVYCLMPTHFHILLRQKKKDGVQKFMTDALNSFTRWYNLKYRRTGPLFLPRFRSNRIVNDSQLIHVSRYIHLNPLSSGLLAKIDALNNYPWSSYSEYIAKKRKKDKVSNPKEILSFFNDKSTTYIDFVVQQANYQKTLEELKYLKKW